MRFAFWVSSVVVLFGALACTRSPDASAPYDNALRLATETPQQKAQYEANLAFARDYTARCAVLDPTLPRAIVTGFGQFLHVLENPSGQTVAELVAMPYPQVQVLPGAVAKPTDFAAVQTRVLQLGNVRANVCGMVLPVFWDLAPAMVAREIAAFAPQAVVMNGVGYNGDPLRLELGSTNRATTLAADGTGQLRAANDDAGAPGAARVLPEFPIAHTRASFFPFAEVRAAVDTALGPYKRPPDPNGFTTYMPGVAFGAYPSELLEYLCNNVVYTTNTLLDEPARDFRVLENADGTQGLTLRLSASPEPVVRAFVHWPPPLGEGDAAQAQVIMKTLVGAALEHRAKAVYGSALTGV